MKQAVLFLLVLALVAAALAGAILVCCAPVRAASATRPPAYWIVYARNGDLAVGWTAGGRNTLACTVSSRKSVTVGKVTGFSGGVVSTRRTWAQFCAAERR